MRFITRAVIAILAGIGAGTLGFATAWHAIQAVWNVHPGVGFDNWLIASIFAPGILFAVLVFHSVSTATSAPQSQ